MKENKMGIMPVPKLLFTMALPAICSMLLQSIYNIVDSLFVARISEQALGAVTLVFPIQMLIVSVGVGAGIGVNSVISRRLGEQKQEEANSAANHGYLIAIFHWVLFAICGFAFTRPFFQVYSDSENLVDLATTFGSIVMIGSLFVFVQITSEKILQATGNMIMPMISNMVGCVVNIILNPILIFGYFGFPALGVAGSACATIIGQFIGMTCILCAVIFGKHHVKVSFKNFSFQPKIIKNIYSVGIPSMIMQAITSVLIGFLNKILISYSEAAMTVLGIYFRLQSFIFMPVFGLTQGAMPILGYNYGARNKDRLLKTMKLATGTAVSIMLVGLILFQVFPDFMLDMFKASAETKEIGVSALRLISLCFVPAAFGIIASTLFQAIGHGFLSLLMSLLRQLILILPIAFILSKFFGPTGVWVAYPLAEIGALLFATILFARVYNREIKFLDRT